MSTLSAISALRRNILEVLDAELFRLPYRQIRWLGRRYLLVCDPELMQAIFLDQVEHFPKAEAQQRILRPVVGEGLLSAEGVDWRRQRKAAAPAFRHEALQRIVPAFAAVAEETARRLCAQDGEILDIMPEMTRATLDVVVRTLLAGEGDAVDRDAISLMVTEYLEALGNPDLFDVFGAPSWIPRPWRARYSRMVKAMRRMAAEAVRRRRARGDFDSHDLLGALLAARDPEMGAGLTDTELVDNLLTFILAGHETTAVTLTWTLYLIANDPEVQDRLRAEAEAAFGSGPITVDGLQRLPFHGEVIKEAMRLFTPAPVMQRRVTRDLDLRSVQLKKGDEAVCHLYVLHRSELLWERPEAFDPDRFSPERSVGRHRFAFMPFSGGPRVCIGARFATMEAATFLATFVRAFRVEPGPGPGPLPRMRVTLRPEGGMPLMIRRVRTFS